MVHPSLKKVGDVQCGCHQWKVPIKSILIVLLHWSRGLWELVLSFATIKRTIEDGNVKDLLSKTFLQLLQSYLAIKYGIELCIEARIMDGTIQSDSNEAG